MTRVSFIRAINRYSERHLGLLAVDDGNPYDVNQLVDDALAAGQSAKSFVREHFAEDFWRMEYDESMARDAGY